MPTPDLKDLAEDLLQTTLDTLDRSNPLDPHKFLRQNSIWHSDLRYSFHQQLKATFGPPPNLTHLTELILKTILAAADPVKHPQPNAFTLPHSVWKCGLTIAIHNLLKSTLGAKPCENPPAPQTTSLPHP